MASSRISARSSSARTSAASPSDGRSKSTRAKLPRAKRERLEVDERREQFLAIGLEAFAETAYDQVSIDDVARAAGISKGLLYHYFPTKRDFYAAVLERAAEQLLERTRTDPSLPLQERFQRGLDAYLGYVSAHAPAYGALLRGGIGSDPVISAIIEGTRGKFLERLLSDMPAASAAPALRTALRGWVGYVEATSLDWIDHKDVSIEWLRDHLIELMLFLVSRVGPTAG